MRMAELSDRSGVPVPTIKWWRREGLVPAGRATATNQAEYDQRHVARLRLLSVLREVADVPTAALRSVVDAIDDPDRSLHEVVGTAHAALDPGPHEPASEAASAAVDTLLDGLGWAVGVDAPARGSLARTVDALRTLGRTVEPDGLIAHARAAAAVAAAEVNAIDVDGRARDEVVADVVVGTILYEHVLTALRRLAQEHVSRERWTMPEA